MASPHVTLSPDGTTATLTCSRTDLVAVVASLSRTKFEETIAVQKAIVGDAPWQREAGEGTGGPIARSEMNEFLQNHGLPLAP